MVKTMGYGWRRGGVRARLVAVSVVGVALALGLGIVVIANLLNRSLVLHLGASADAAALMAGDALANDGVVGVEGEDFGGGLRIQVVTALGQVVFSNTADTAAMSSLRPSVGESVQGGAQLWWLPFGDPGSLLVSARGVSFDGQAYVVLVGASQLPTHEAVSTTATIMGALSPLILILVGGITWWLVGRALQPVEAIREQVARLSASRLDDRVPVSNAGDEVAALAVTMNQMLARLSASRSAQLRFVSDASHELRSPLTGLSGLLEVGRTEDSLDTWRYLEPMLTADAQQMAAVVQKLLLLSRLDEGSVAVAGQDVDLDDLAWDEVGRLRASSELTISVDISPVRVVGDRMALSQVLRNLSDNAVRHARTRLRITALLDGALARWVVEDDGSGVPEGDRDRVFERFVRLDESRSRDSGGSGLGLAIVREVVLAHGGSVSVGASEDLGGAKVVVELPAHSTAEPATIR